MKPSIRHHCDQCRLTPELCYCDLVPRIDLATRVSLVMHALEAPRASNTGKLLHQALTNSTIKIFGDQSDWRSWKDLVLPNYDNVVLSLKSPNILSKRETAGEHAPLNLIIPDGNWHQGNRMTRRLVLHYGLRTVRLPAMDTRSFELRRPHAEPNGVSTIEAAAAALGLVESPKASQDLLAIFQIMVERHMTLKTRSH